jgi:hypothetical protein
LNGRTQIAQILVFAGAKIGKLFMLDKGEVSDANEVWFWEGVLTSFRPVDLHGHNLYLM